MAFFSSAGCTVSRKGNPFIASAIGLYLSEPPLRDTLYRSQDLTLQPCLNFHQHPQQTCVDSRLFRSPSIVRALPAGNCSVTLSSIRMTEGMIPCLAVARRVSGSFPTGRNSVDSVFLPGVSPAEEFLLPLCLGWPSASRSSDSELQRSGKIPGR